MAQSNQTFCEASMTSRWMLKAYQSTLKTHPEARWPFLDDLIVKQKNGELTMFVEKAGSGATGLRETACCYRLLITDH
jgi:hypothetical protein